MQDKEKGQFDGFIFNNIIYFIAMFIGSLFPFVARTALSFMIKTPHPSELKADGSYLFDVVYPLVGIFTLAAFIIGGWYCCYVVSSKVAYKTGRETDSLKMKIQMILPAILMFAWNLYFGFVDKFSGMMGIQFWYPAAVTASLFGLFDKTDLLSSLSSLDLVTNSFVLEGLFSAFPFLTVFYAVLYSAGFSVACYFGRKKGMAVGVSKKAKYLEEIRGSSARP